MKSLKSMRLVFILLITLISEQQLFAQIDTSINGTENAVNQVNKIFNDYNDLNKPGASIAVVKGNKIVFKKGFGSANLEYDIPVSPSTIFHIASVSKQFTAFSILLLAHEGKLSLDDDIRHYLPEVPDFGKTITLRHLATHTSGLRDQWSLLAMAGWRLDDVITKEHVLKLVQHQKELNFDPGEEYLYCNTGFTLLAEVVSRVSGQSFAEFTQSNIFDPLGMSHTLFYDDHEKIVKNRAYSYYADDSGYKKSVLSYANVGATSLFTTVEDLSAWVLNFSTPKVGNIEIIHQLNTLAELNNGETFGGAYGQFINQYKGLKQIQHGGADAGYRSYLGRFPDQNFAVIVLSNMASANPTDLALQVTDLFLKDQLIETSNKERTKKSYIKLETSQLREFEGTYWNEEGSFSRKIYIKNDTLMYWRGESNETPMVPINENTFEMLNVGVDLIVQFETSNDEKNMVVRINNGEPIISSFYTPAKYSVEELNQFTGTFYSAELQTYYTFVVKNGQLVATHPRLSDIQLSPIKEDDFSGNKWFFSSIKYLRNANGSITGISVSNQRARNLQFDKIANRAKEGPLESSRYHRLASGLKNSQIKFERDKEGRIAFLGGSITYNSGWRDSICAYLEKRFPETAFEFIGAGIPSMGTTPAAFRLERDVLSKGKIDLLFEEAAVNDASNGRTSTEQIRAMEGIVRNLRTSNPDMDMVIMHFVDPDKIADYNQGIEPKVITNHNKVAVHYHIPTINLAKEVTERINNEEFTWEDDFKNLHPSPFGQGVYSRSMLKFLDNCYSGHLDPDDKITAHHLPNKIDELSYDQGHLLDISLAILDKGWNINPSWNPKDGTGTRANYVKVPMLISEKPGSKLKLKFKGKAIGIAVAAGQDAGHIKYRIDDNEWEKLNLFTRWSKHLHLPWYYTLANGLTQEEHVLEIRIAKTKDENSNGNACRIRYFYVNEY